MKIMMARRHVKSAVARGLLIAVLTSGPFVTGAAAESISDTLNSWFFGKPATEDKKPAASGPVEVDCPGVEVRQGASTLAINAPGETGPLTTRYQVSIAQTARECTPAGGVMTMKVGVQGRILLGPAGGPGQVDIPLRVAVVEEGPNPKPVVSKLYRLAIPVPPGQTAVPFTHVDPDISFPMPRNANLEAYVVYVGFDPSAAPAKPERKVKAKQK